MHSLVDGQSFTYTVPTLAPARVRRTYKSEFRDYDGDFPSLEGWYDSSWHNDVCPSLTKDNEMWTIWVDYVDPSRRELGGKRYAVTLGTSEGASGDELDRSSRLSTDNWQDVLDFFGIVEKGPVSCQRYIEV